MSRTFRNPSKIEKGVKIEPDRTKGGVLRPLYPIHFEYKLKI